MSELAKFFKKKGRTLPPPANKSTSGKSVVRVGPELHQVPAIRALSEGAGLSSYTVRPLKKNLLG